MSSIYLIRHGQAGFGRQNYDMLTELGMLQAKTLGQHFAKLNVEPTRVICGDMERHRLTRDNALAELTSNWQLSADNSLWNEFDHEEVLSVFDKRFATPEKLMAEMKASANAKAFFVKQFGSAIARWTSGDFDSDYRESWQSFYQRVNQGLDELVSQLTYQQTAQSTAQEKHQQNVFVFTSGGVISAIMMKLMNIPHSQLIKLNMNIANASVTELKVNQFGIMVHKFNDYSAISLADALSEQKLVTFA